MKFQEEAIKKESAIREVFVKPTLRANKMTDAERAVIATVTKKPSIRNYVSRVMRTEQRDNRGFGHMPKEMMKDGYIVIGSSYTQAADPNTMRNFGPNRNAIYNYQNQSANMSSDTVSNADSFISQQSSTRGYNTDKYSKRKANDLNPYNFYTVVRNADYTKNMSQSIFIPGHLPSDYSKRQPVNDTQSEVTVQSKRVKKERTQSAQVYGAPQRGRNGNDSKDIAKTLGQLDKDNISVYKTKQSTHLPRREPEKGRLNSAVRPRIPKEKNYAKVDRMIMKLANDISKMPEKQVFEKPKMPQDRSDRYKKLRDEIREEKRLKNELRNELHQIKTEMERRLDLVNLKMSSSGQNNMTPSPQE